MQLTCPRLINGITTGNRAGYSGTDIAMSVSEPQAARTQDGVESELKGKEKKKKQSVKTLRKVANFQAPPFH